MAKASRSEKAKQIQPSGVFDPLRAALKSSFLRHSIGGKTSETKAPAKPQKPASKTKARSVAKAAPAKTEAKAEKPSPGLPLWPKRTHEVNERVSALSNSRYPRSPLAPKSLPELPPIPGIKIATIASGQKYKGRDDLLLALFDEGTSVAGVFTRSSMASAPVDWCRANLEGKGDAAARALIINAGNSNAFTGRAGVDAVKAVGAALADLLSCRRRDIFQASTGVIGQPFQPVALTRHFEKMIEHAGEAGFDAAARAIMTTDTFPKAATATAMIDGVPVTINGIAKGSGMIAPDMATMLSFIFTDAAIPSPILQTLLVLTVRDTFNIITVDGDTSTSDTVLLFASGKAEHPAISRAGDARLADFRDKLEQVCADLARQVVRDGEGASKFIRVHVTGAESAKAARTVAFAIGNSPLVKTAIAGEDANWGRVVMAVGKSGEKADRDKLVIKFGDLPVASKGGVDPRHNEKALTEYMEGQEIDIEVDLGIGKGEAEIWTCDFTHGYISINADYRS
ncbi:MAG: bifunctional glutamate N-acetyltransferase/amino-acid acetyltransferase ArgJ [Alphaproteobacteria bacterium]